MTGAQDGLLRLRSALVDGRLEELCASTGIELLVLFGSAVSEADPGDAELGDVDIAVAFADPLDRDFLAAVTALIDLLGDAVDVLDLDRAGPVARQRALTQGEVLLELRPGAFATRQMTAIREFIETEPFRWLDLELMAR